MKRAQIQMAENIAVLIVLVFIIMIGVMFFTRIRQHSVKTKLTEFSELSLIKLADLISGMPEFSCSVNGVVQANCVDLLKSEAFVNLSLVSLKTEYYYNLFGKSKISFVSVFPYEYNKTVYDSPYNNSNALSVFVPINLYDPINDSLNFGYIQITKYIRVY